VLRRRLSPWLPGAAGPMDLADQMELPAPPPTAEHAPSILCRRLAPIARRSRPRDVRPQRDRGHVASSCPGSWCLSREPVIAFVAVLEGARRARAEPTEPRPARTVRARFGRTARPVWGGGWVAEFGRFTLMPSRTADLTTTFALRPHSLCHLPAHRATGYTSSGDGRDTADQALSRICEWQNRPRNIQGASPENPPGIPDAQLPATRPNRNRSATSFGLEGRCSIQLSYGRVGGEVPV
jgi:hypothetical protein